MNFSQDKQLEVSVRFRHPDTADSSSRSVEIESFRYRNDHHQVRTIREMIQDGVGHYAFFHFVVETDRDRIFNVVFDTEAFAWYMIDEAEPA